MKQNKKELPYIHEVLQSSYMLTPKVRYIYPYWRDKLDEFNQSEASIGVFTGAIGCGKSSACVLQMIYDYLILQLMNDPNETLEMPGDLYFVVVSKSIYSAREIVCYIQQDWLDKSGTIANLKEQGKFKENIKFQAMDIKTNKVDFMAKNLVSVLYDSADTHNNHTLQQEIVSLYNRLRQHGCTGFGKYRHLLINSSECKKHSFDFLKLFPPSFINHSPIWDVRHGDYFNLEDVMIRPSFNFVIDDEVITVPSELRTEFEKEPKEALENYYGWSYDFD